MRSARAGSFVVLCDAKSAAAIKTVSPIKSGAATRRISSRGLAPESRAAIITTAAAGLIVRPKWAASDVTAPRRIGSSPSDSGRRNEELHDRDRRRNPAPGHERQEP